MPRKSSVFGTIRPIFDEGDAVAARVGPGGEELGPHGRAGVTALVGDGPFDLLFVDQAEVLVHDQEVPQPVQGALLGAGEYRRRR